MDKISFLVQGSANEPYEVTFERENNQIAAFCTCPAGANGTYCKHRLFILDGVISGIVSDNADQAVTVASWLRGSNLAADIENLSEAERVLEQAKSNVNKAKKNLAAAMMRRKYNAN
ncbi:SWIM zinc finger family protein [Paraburkholderia kururiensis]|uniref:SWIM zinc finger family protein n=1 Tax=Paraburkholderia kururiensis TaxID=984307 RepID=UPI000F8942BC|nr:SWIM zinc finger family protein [Paraburkholderia kururiensis]